MCPESRRDADDARPHCGRKGYVNEHQPPGQAVPPLDLTDGHLQEKDAEHAPGEKQFFADPGPVPEERDHEQKETDAEDGGRPDVDVDSVEDVAEALDVRAARVRPGGRDERARDDEDERRRENSERRARAARPAPPPPDGPWRIRPLPPEQPWPGPPPRTRAGSAT